MDGLYDLPPEDFVAARDALARSLRATGARDDAAVVKALRRPTRSAWALNQLARRHADDVAALLDHGRALAEAQERALAGERVDLRQAGRSRMDALRHLTRQAEAILGPGATGQRDEVVATLTAASADVDAGAALAAGRLAEPIEAPSGFGDPLAGCDVVPPRQPRAARRPRPPRGPTPGSGAATDGGARAPGAEANAAVAAAEREAEANAAVAAAEREAEAARAAAAAARRAVHASTAAALRADERVAALEAELADARAGAARAHAVAATDAEASAGADRAVDEAAARAAAARAAVSALA